jgi:putative FmdB family regulatory protein
MPIGDFKCHECGHEEKDKLYKVSPFTLSLVLCPKCHFEMDKVISAPARTPDLWYQGKR